MGRNNRSAYAEQGETMTKHDELQAQHAAALSASTDMSLTSEERMAAMKRLATLRQQIIGLSARRGDEIIKMARDIPPLPEV